MEKIWDILIVGAGPAGLSAAVYGCRAGYSVLVLEKLVYGGQIANSPEVENYPAIKKISGFEFATGLYEQATALGAELRFEEAVKARLEGREKIVTTSAGSELQARTVILANGANRRKLGVPGEEELAGRGVSYCATCDGPFYKGMETAIVGGGNTALEDAIYLAGLCKRVHVIHRRDSFRGSKILEDQLRSRENVTLHLQRVVEEIEGDGQVEAVRLRSTAPGEEELVETLPVAGVFAAVGLVPENGAFAPWAELDAQGYYAAGEDCTTKTAGVFVAGDARQKTLRQLVTAAADGAMAATQAAHYLQTI